MSAMFVDCLPDLSDPTSFLSLRVFGHFAFVRSPRFISRICLDSGTVEWLVERSPAQPTESIGCLRRRIRVSGSDLWISATGDVLVEIMSTECGGLTVSARHTETGRQLWEHFIPCPDAADDAVSSLALPDGQTAEIFGFLAQPPESLVVCLSHDTGMSTLSSPNLEILNPRTFECQTDAVRFDPLTGKTLWKTSFLDVRVGILERRAFTGIWSNANRLGRLDFQTGTNSMLYESPNFLGSPLRNGSELSVPWHSTREVGVDWIDEWGGSIRNAAWPQLRVRNTKLHATESGLALQTNDQRLWWLGREDSPSWSIRAKPYIYRVHCSPTTNVFVGTDGNGGHLLGLDPISGQETHLLKPALGGVGYLAKVPGHDVLIAPFRISRTHSVPARLLVFSMRDRTHDLHNQCQVLLGTWEHGAVCLSGAHCEQFAIIDVRNFDK